ncbi:MAG TPA: hypothetical protein V6D33_11730 [Cyanophyceae cyanobacterium]
MIQADSGFLLLALFFSGVVIALLLELLIPAQIAAAIGFAIAVITAVKIFQF